MELNPDHKMDKVTIVPEAWIMTSLTNLCVPNGLIRGPFGGAIKKSFFVSNGYKVYEQKNAIYKSIELGDAYINEEKRAELKRFTVCDGDFIVSCSGTIGRIYQIPQNAPAGIINQALLLIRVNTQIINRDLFCQIFESSSFQEGIIDNSHGGAMPNIVGMGIFKNIKITHPTDLHEQAAIAGALTDTDALIAKLDQLIAKKCAIRQAVKYQLLTGQKRLPGFKGEWEDTTLSSLGLLKKGKGITKSDLISYGNPCIRYGEIYTKYNYYFDKCYSYINDQTALISQKIKHGDLLFTCSGETPEEIAKCVVYLGTEEAYAGGDIIIVSPSNCNSLFLAYLLNSDHVVAQKISMAQGDAVVHISTTNLKLLSFRLPSLEEQTAVADIIFDMDKEIKTLERRRDKTKAIKEAMMQELLTGRIRLV